MLSEAWVVGGVVLSFWDWGKEAEKGVLVVLGWTLADPGTCMWHLGQG